MDANTVAWFEVATGDADGAQEFYGELFGWWFAADPDAARVGMDYRLISYPGGEAPVGGISAPAASCRITRCSPSRWPTWPRPAPSLVGIFTPPDQPS